MLPPDELPKPIAAPPPVPAVPLKFDEKGRFADAETAKEAGRLGGLAAAKARQVAKLLRTMGLKATSEEFRVYREAGEEFVEQHLKELAQMAGGRVGSGPRALVMHAGWQMAFSAFFKDKAAEMPLPDVKVVKEASLFGDSMRQNIMAAYELAVKEAQVRPKEAFDPLAGYLEPANDGDK